MRVGFAGLGTMGGPMAGHLERAGHAPAVWNRTAAKAAGFKNPVDSPEELARQAYVIFLCLGNDHDVREVTNRLLSAAQPGTLIVDHSTISPEGARAMHTLCQEKGSAFLDAPITGGSMGAQAGTLTIFCGGDRADYDRAEPMMAAYAKRSRLVGGPGAGQTMKAVNQIAVGGALLGLAESFAFAEAAGLDLAEVREMIGGGAAGSWAIEHYGPKIIHGDMAPGFSIDHQRKDFAICRAAAEALGLPLPATELADALLAPLQEEGRGQEATAAIIDSYRRSRQP